MANGYDQGRDGSFVGWWIKWMTIGILMVVAAIPVIVHVCNVRVEKQKQYREECYKWGPRDSDGDAVCDRSFMPSYTSTGPYFTPAAGGRPGS